MRNLITDVAGLKVGNAEDIQLGSGTTVVLFDRTRLRPARRPSAKACCIGAFEGIG